MAYIGQMPYDEPILNGLGWLESVGYVGLFAMFVWLLTYGPLRWIGEGHDWVVIAVLGAVFPALVYALRALDEPTLLTKCAAAFHSSP